MTGLDYRITIEAGDEAKAAASRASECGVWLASPEMRGGYRS